MSDPLCFYCRYFQPDDICLELTEEDWDEVLPGQCRKHPPQVGDLLNEGTNHQEHWFGNFPRVMASDWCGAFQPRKGVLYNKPSSLADHSDKE